MGRPHFSGVGWSALMSSGIASRGNCTNRARTRGEGCQSVGCSHTGLRGEGEGEETNEVDGDAARVPLHGVDSTLVVVERLTVRVLRLRVSAGPKECSSNLVSRSCAKEVVIGRGGGGNAPLSTPRVGRLVRRTVERVVVAPGQFTSRVEVVGDSAA